MSSRSAATSCGELFEAPPQDLFGGLDAVLAERPERIEQFLRLAPQECVARIGLVAAEGIAGHEPLGSQLPPAVGELGIGRYRLLQGRNRLGDAPAGGIGAPEFQQEGGRIRARWRRALPARWPRLPARRGCGRRRPAAGLPRRARETGPGSRWRAAPRPPGPSPAASRRA